MIAPSWVTAFVDLPASGHPSGQQFWQDVTGYVVSPTRGRHHEFTTLVPSVGDPHLRVQRLDEGPPRIHVDLHVADLPAAADQATALGATEVAALDDVVVLRSPGGLPFCLVGERLSTVAPPADWADGSRSIVDQVCLDIPASGFDTECRFWADLTGWELSASSGFPEFARLARPVGIAVRFLLQRLGESSGSVRAHLDLASSSRAEETLRHARLGATVEREHGRWTVLRDPAAMAYCITDRDPGRCP